MHLRDSLLVIVDVQDRLLKIIPGKKELIANIKLIAEYYKRNKQPIIMTKQVKLGDIVDELKDYDDIVVEKKHFSCMRERKFREKLSRFNVRTIVLTGIETHICILQTALDMLKEGYTVIIPPDAVASQIESDHRNALEYLRGRGVEIIPVESLVYMDMESPDHKQFKHILEYVKKRRKELTR